MFEAVGAGQIPKCLTEKAEQMPAAFCGTKPRCRLRQFDQNAGQFPGLSFACTYPPARSDKTSQDVPQQVIQRIPLEKHTQPSRLLR